MGRYIWREATSPVSLYGKYSNISHTPIPYRRSSCWMNVGLGRISPPHQDAVSAFITALRPLRNTKAWTSTPADEMPKQPSCMYKGRGNSRNFSGETAFHGNCSHVSWAKWGPCRRLQKILNLSSQPETEATGKRYPLLRKPEFTLAFPVSPYNNKLLMQSQVLPGMAHYPYNKRKPKEQIRKLSEGINTKSCCVLRSYPKIKTD